MHPEDHEDSVASNVSPRNMVLNNRFGEEDGRNHSLDEETDSLREREEISNRMTKATFERLAISGSCIKSKR
jgi:hypothetical protein